MTPSNVFKLLHLDTSIAKKTDPFKIDLGLPKMNLNIGDMDLGFGKARDNSLLFGLGHTANEFGSTIRNTKKDYEEFRNGVSMMKKDLTPPAKALARNGKRFGGMVKKNSGPFSNQNFFVLTNRDGVVIKHNYRDQTAAKRFMELARGSGSYDNVSEVQIEPR